MNALCRLIAISFVILQGCTSYSVLTQEEMNKGMIPSETTIRITRYDRSVIESGPFRHVLVREPSDLVIGSGSERKSAKPFAGKVQRSEIDSARQIQVKDQNGVQQTHFIFWLKNKTSLAFTEYDYLNITPEHQPGLWCAGSVTEGDQTRPFKGRIDSSTIRKVETNRLGNLEGPALFAPSLPSSGGPAKGQFNWTSLGIGPLETDRDRGAILVSFSLLSSASLYSVRFTTVPHIDLGYGGPAFSVYELAAMYGIAFKSRFLAVSVSAGISYAGGSEQIPSDLGYKTVEFSTASFPLDLELSLTPTSAVGVAVKFYSTSNSRKSWNGIAFCLQYGEL